VGPQSGKSLRPWQGLDIPQLLKQFSISPKKTLGQSFLICDHVADKIVAAAGTDDVVVEIGAGTGMLTVRLASHYKNVIAIEIDQRLKALHNMITADFPNVVFVYEDFLKWIPRPTEIPTVVGNLPYYITTPILEKVFFQMKPKTMVFMVQKELGARMVANPGSKTYGALSVFVQSFTKPEMLFHVTKNCFYPAPEVDSVVVKLEGIYGYEEVVDPEVLEHVVKRAFQQRRKMLRSGLKKEPLLLKKAEEAGIDTSLRPEQITVEQYVRWATLVKRQNTA